MKFIQFICFWTGVGVWFALTAIVLVWIYHMITSALSVTRWHWRCSSGNDPAPRWHHVVLVFFIHLKTLMWEGINELSIGRSYWRAKGDWKIVPEPKTKQPE